MSTSTPQRMENNSVRERAEKSMKEHDFVRASLTPATDPLKLVHELQVHQIELELQKEELVQTRNQLERTLGQYTELYDYAPSGYFNLSRDGRIRQVNHAGARLLGQTRTRLVNDRFQCFIQPAFIEAFERLLREVYSGEVPCCAFLELAPVEGQKRFIQIEAQVTAGDTDCRIIVSDLTQYRLLELEKEKLRVQLFESQKMNTIGRLAGGVAHDFNNMLCGMLLQLGLLEMRPDLDEDMKESFRELKLEAQRASNLTKQLLLFSRRAPINPAPIDLNRLISQLLKMLRRLVRENYSLEYSEGGDTPLVNADTCSMEQVLMNLVLNAGDAMPEGGPIRITSYVRDWTEADQAANPRRRKGRFACIEVSDTGSGISPEHLPLIFEPFFTTKGVGKGTGLGLSTVDGIVSQHQGWIEVDSIVGKGSCFRVCLPQLSEPHCDTRAQEAPAAPQRGTETILLVEDEDVVRSTTRICLDHLGYHILEARSADEALQVWAAKGGSIDLLLTDMVMPGSMSGLALAQLLHKSRVKLPVIIMSGFSDELATVKPESAPGIEVMFKPFSMGELSGCIRRGLRAQHPSQA